MAAFHPRLVLVLQSLASQVATKEKSLNKLYPVATDERQSERTVTFRPLLLKWGKKTKSSYPARATQPIRLMVFWGKRRKRERESNREKGRKHKLLALSSKKNKEKKENR